MTMSDNTNRIKKLNSFLRMASPNDLIVAERAEVNEIVSFRQAGIYAHGLLKTRYAILI
jgi:hypothetical protein